MAVSLSMILYNLSSIYFEPHRFDRYIERSAAKYALDPALIRAVIHTETKFNPFAVGGAGEIGIMQILPGGAAADYARANRRPEYSRSELFDPELNIDIGSWYLAQGLNKYRDRADALELAVCRYNAGDSRARRWSEASPGSVAAAIDIPSTRTYLEKVLSRVELYKKIGKNE